MCKARKVSAHTLAWNHAILEVSFFAQVAKGVGECLFRVTRSFYEFFSPYTRNTNSVNGITTALNNRYSSVCCLHLRSMFKKSNNWLKNNNISFPGGRKWAKTRRSTRECPLPLRLSLQGKGHLRQWEYMAFYLGFCWPGSTPCHSSSFPIARSHICPGVRSY